MAGNELSRHRINRRNIEASFDMVVRSFERLAKIGGISDEPLELAPGQDPPTLGEQIGALGQILKVAHKYFPELRSFGDIEKRLWKSLEPGGALYRRLVEFGWTPPQPKLPPELPEPEEARH